MPDPAKELLPAIEWGRGEITLAKKFEKRKEKEYADA
jgi:hypothetical protein